MYGSQGHLLYVHAPWIKHSVMCEGGDGVVEPYIIPRGNGTVVVGGTGIVCSTTADTSGASPTWPCPTCGLTVSRSAEAAGAVPGICGNTPGTTCRACEATIFDRIASRAVALLPSLAGAKVLGRWAGVRPKRRAGLRCEVQWIDGASGDYMTAPILKAATAAAAAAPAWPSAAAGAGAAVPVIHCYGHGGSGFTCSWGGADAVVQLAALVQQLGQRSKLRAKL